MPIHDWTRVVEDIFHSIHLSWVVEIQRALNTGILPDTHYAMTEPNPTHTDDEEILGELDSDVFSKVTPLFRHHSVSPQDFYIAKRRTIVIRHVSRDRVVALLEIVSPGNKSSRRTMRAFVDKAVETIERGYHLGVVDLFPVGPHDSKGIHHLIWSHIDNAQAYELPADEPLTQATYYSGDPKNAFIEPTAVGRELIELPVFLRCDLSVLVPMESTYQEAFRGMPKKWRQVLEAGV